MLKDTQWGQGFRQCFLKIKRTDKSIYNGGLSWIMSYSCVLICNDLVVQASVYYAFLSPPHAY